MTRPDVIILGAGASGLAAARILSDAGRRILILEARDRIGGRIHTIHDPAFAAPVELGAEFIHGRPKPTWDLIRDSGLTAIDLPFDSHRKHAGRLGKLDDFSDELARVMGGLARLKGRDISFAEYLRRHHGKRDSAEARKLAIAFVEGFDAADTERISARSLAEEQEGLGDVGEEKQFRLIRGYGALMDHLRQSLKPARTTLRLRSPVSAITWSRRSVQVRIATPRAPIVRAPRVLITLPIGILQLPPDHPGAIRFAPDIPAKRRAAQQLGSGPVVKVLLSFQESFWESPSAIRAARADDSLKDASFLHNPGAAFPTFWTARPLHIPMLTGWAGGPSAAALSGRPHKQIIAAALDSLADLFNLRRARIAAMLRRAHVADWAADPLARGAYSYVTVGASAARSNLARPIQGTLFFAGEAADTSGQASTVAGAIASGQHAARQILA